MLTFLTGQSLTKLIYSWYNKPSGRRHRVGLTECLCSEKCRLTSWRKATSCGPDREECCFFGNHVREQNFSSAVRRCLQLVFFHWTTPLRSPIRSRNCLTLSRYVISCALVLFFSYTAIHSTFFSTRDPYVTPKNDNSDNGDTISTTHARTLIWDAVNWHPAPYHKSHLADMLFPEQRATQGLRLWDNSHLRTSLFRTTRILGRHPSPGHLASLRTTRILGHFYLGQHAS